MTGAIVTSPFDVVKVSRAIGRARKRGEETFEGSERATDEDRALQENRQQPSTRRMAWEAREPSSRD